MAKRVKPESTQSKGANFSSDLLFAPDHEFMELLWENGQIVTQVQPNRPRKSSLCIGLSSQTSNILEKVECVPSVQEEDIAPWLNYPIDDPLPNDYCSDFLSEITRVNLNPLSYQSINDPIEKNSMLYQGCKDSCTNENINPGSSNVIGSVSSITKNGQGLTLQRSQDVGSYLKSEHLDPISCNNVTPHQTSHGYLSQIAIPTPEVYNDSVQQHDLLSSHKRSQRSNTNVVNFSHFSGSSSHFRVNSHGSNTIKTGLRFGNPNIQDKLHVTEFQGKLDSSTSEPDGKLPNQSPIEQVCLNQSEEISREEISTSCTSPDHALCQSLSFAASAAIGKLDTESATELGVVSSSVCSGNTLGGLTTFSNGGTKRKGREVEERESQSEDVEEELVDVRKSIYTRGSGAKRSRAAEVHNLSERRRRDRINEKMRALQELIPNCNKVDKASMLDEAIEYLKSLQLQVQIMSMATGLCMPPMMLPAGMQPTHAPPMAPLSSINVGMNMGMDVGYSMGMLDTSCSTACSMISGGPPRLPCPPLSATAILHGMPQVGLPMFGMPGRGLPISVPHIPFISMPGFSPMPSRVSDVVGAPSPLPVITSASLSNFKEKLPSQTSEECLVQPTLMQRDSQVSDIDSENAIISGRRDGIDSNVASSGS